MLDTVVFHVGVMGLMFILSGCIPDLGNGGGESDVLSTSNSADFSNTYSHPGQSNRVTIQTLGLPMVSDDEWDDTAVRKVLHTFAYGGHATDAQIAAWGGMSPNEAIVEILTFEEHNVLLSPLSAANYDQLDKRDGTLRGLGEFWSSDDTDALQRIFIQWGTSHLYPANAMACHVSVVPNHQTKRVSPLKFRFDVAMTGRMGFELNPATMSPEDVAFAQKAVACYKSIRPVVQQGDLYRLISPYSGNFSSLMYVSEDKKRAVVFVYCLRHMVGENYLPPIRLQGLDPAVKYQVAEINRLNNKTHSDLVDKTVSGELLREAGIPVNLRGDFDSAVFELVAEE